MSNASRVALAVSFTLASAAWSGAVDWPQFRGANGDGISAEIVNLKWAATGPKVLWKTETKNGFSSFAIAGGKAYTLVVRDLNGEARTLCLALDAATGKELWAADVDAGKYDGSGNAGTQENKGGDGPRCTPTVSDGKVYVFTPPLVVICLDAASGKTLWTRDLIKDHAGRNIGWKNAASVPVDGDLLFVAGGGPGESALALNKNTGAVVWKSLDDKITHGTPLVATLHGVRQVIYFMQSGLVSVAAQDGKELWRFPFRYNVSTAFTPIQCGPDTVYCSAGYGVGGGVCRIEKDGNGFKAVELWKITGDDQVANHWSTPVYKDGYLYGMFSFKKYGTGPLKCVEVKTGKVMWSEPNFGAGNVMLAGQEVIALADDGQVVIVAAKPEAYQEISRFKAVAGKCWTSPALANGRLYVRSTKEGACLDVSAK